MSEKSRKTKQLDGSLNYIASETREEERARGREGDQEKKGGVDRRRER